MGTVIKIRVEMRQHSANVWHCARSAMLDARNLFHDADLRVTVVDGDQEVTLVSALPINHNEDTKLFA